jgi:hypothetical protein
MRPELLAAMYPDLDRWRAVRRRVDPDGVLASDLGRRLGLVGPPVGGGSPPSRAGKSALASVAGAG